MTLALAIGSLQRPRTRWFQRRQKQQKPQQKPTRLGLMLDGPHLLVLGVSGSGKTVMCEYITSAIPGPFVFLGRDPRNSEAEYGGVFPKVPDENFFSHDSTWDEDETRRSLAETLDAAAARAIDLGAALIIDEISFYLNLDREHFFQVIENLTEAGVRIIFTAMRVPAEDSIQQLKVGALALLGFMSGEFKRAYPELTPYLSQCDKRGEFILWTPELVSVGLSAPAPGNTETTPENPSLTRLFLGEGDHRALRQGQGT